MEKYFFGKSDANIVLVQPVDEHYMEMAEREAALIREYTGADFLLAAFKVENWNKDLSPWKAPAVFGKEDFGEGAADTLADILNYCKDSEKTYFLGGYSLAGLFSLWAAYQTDIFSGIAAASPSMWFPQFTDYMKDNSIMTRAVYLSLGDRESKVRNPVMATVGDKIEEACALLKERNISVTLEWNQGNHFKDSEIRTAKAFAWLFGMSLHIK